MLVLAFGMIAPNLGSEFVPKLSEGAVTIGIVRLAGTDLEESMQINSQMEQIVLKHFRTKCVMFGVGSERPRSPLIPWGWS